MKPAWGDDNRQMFFVFFVRKIVERVQVWTPRHESISVTRCHSIDFADRLRSLIVCTD